MKASIVFLSLFISVLYLFGFFVLGYGLWSARRSTLAATWPTTPATITHLELHHDERPRMADSSDGSSYRVNVRYTYTVDDVTYEGDRLAFGYAGCSRRDVHDGIHQRLKGAKEIAVRYDPEDPSVSCLSFGLHQSIVVALTFGVWWLLMLSSFVISFWLSSTGDRVLLENLKVQ